MKNKTLICSLSFAGTYHTEHNIECQDYTASCDSGGYALIVIADGVSTCTKGGTGARIAAETTVRLFKSCADILLKFTAARLARTVMDEVRFELQKTAKAENKSIGDYSSTLAFAVLDKTNGTVTVFSLGDSAAVLCGTNGTKVFCCPEKDRKGTYTTTTPNGDSTVQIIRYPICGYDRIMLFTDGGWDTVEKMSEDPTFPSFTQEQIAQLMYSSSPYDDCSFISMKF